MTRIESTLRGLLIRGRNVLVCAALLLSGCAGMGGNSYDAMLLLSLVNGGMTVPDGSATATCGPGAPGASTCLAGASTGPNTQNQ